MVSVPAPRDTRPYTPATLKALNGAIKLSGHLEALLEAGEHNPVRIFRLVRGISDAMAQAWPEVVTAYATSERGRWELNDPKARP